MPTLFIAEATVCIMLPLSPSDWGSLVSLLGLGKLRRPVTPEIETRSPKPWPRRGHSGVRGRSILGAVGEREREGQLWLTGWV